MSDLAQARTFDEFLEGIWRQNPVFVMVLGMCPTLAVTVSAVNALSMGLATAFVLVCSCGLVSLIRNIVPKEVLFRSPASGGILAKTGGTFGNR